MEPSRSIVIGSHFTSITSTYSSPDNLKFCFLTSIMMAYHLELLGFLKQRIQEILSTNTLDWFHTCLLRIETFYFLKYHNFSQIYPHIRLIYNLISKLYHRCAFVATLFNYKIAPEYQMPCTRKAVICFLTILL